MATQLQSRYFFPATSPDVSKREQPRKVKTLNMSGPGIDEELGVQTSYIAYETVYYLLNEYGVRLNGYATNGGHNGPPDIDCLKTPEFAEALKNVKKFSLSLKSRHNDEIVESVRTLDISEDNLYPVYNEVISTVVKDDIHWGRIASILVFTASLGSRLHKEGRQDKINALVVWLIHFFKKNIHEWLRRQGGWTGINKAVSPNETTSSNGSSGWLTLAAFGVGAFVVGALLQR